MPIGRWLDVQGELPHANSLPPRLSTDVDTTQGERAENLADRHEPRHGAALIIKAALEHRLGLQACGLAAYLAAYLAACRPGASPSAPMFVTRYLTAGGRATEPRMAEGRVYRLVKVLGHRLGLADLHPHAFRHACAVELLERSGGDVRAVQEHLRHRDVETTPIYTRPAKPRLRRLARLWDEPGSRPPAGSREF